jgi:hypothetical protein
VLAMAVVFIIGLLISSKRVSILYGITYNLFFVLCAIPLVLLFIERLGRPAIDPADIELSRLDTKYYRYLKGVCILFFIIGIMGIIFLLSKYGAFWPMSDPKFRPGSYFLLQPRLLKVHKWKEVPFDTCIFALRITSGLPFGIFSVFNMISFKVWASKKTDG